MKMGDLVGIPVEVSYVYGQAVKKVSGRLIGFEGVFMKLEHDSEFMMINVDNIVKLTKK